MCRKCNNKEGGVKKHRAGVMQAFVSVQMHCGANTGRRYGIGLVVVQLDTESGAVSDRGVMQALVAYNQKEMRIHCGAEEEWSKLEV